MDFDSPIYKVLAHNDTGDAAGHQGGFVVPKDLEEYFPLLRNATSAECPTVDVPIVADLFLGTRFLGSVHTRYQFQTWGGTRSAERRITGGISDLRNSASANDVLIIERGIDNDEHYRFTLIKADVPEYDPLIDQFEGRRWGILLKGSPPVAETEVDESLIEISGMTSQAFSLFDDQAGHTEARTRKISRGRAFKRLVRQIYHDTCAICQLGFHHPNGRSELEAGHIVSRSKKGSDDMRNGLLFCRGHHWAFDNGLIAVNDHYHLIVSEPAKRIPSNEALVDFENKAIKLPDVEENYPSLEALEWHRKNVLI